MIETPEDQATAMQRGALAREIDEQIPLLAAAAHRLVEVVLDARQLAIPHDSSAGSASSAGGGRGRADLWRGQASVAFSEASRLLARDLLRIAEDLASARVYCTEASAEVSAGV